MAFYPPHQDWAYRHLQHDDAQLFDQLRVCSHLLSSFAQRINEKNVIIHEKNVIIYNLQENFNRERSAMSYQMSTLQTELAVERRKVKTENTTIERVKIVAREIRNGEEVEEVCQRDEAEFPTSSMGSEQAKQQISRSKSLEAERYKIPHRALEAESQRGQLQVLVQRRLERAASQSPTTTAEAESWQSARETVSPSIEHAPQHAPRPEQSQEQSQGQGQEQGPRKRKRAVRSGYRS